MVIVCYKVQNLDIKLSLYMQSCSVIGQTFEQIGSIIQKLRVNSMSLILPVYMLWTLNPEQHI